MKTPSTNWTKLFVGEHAIGSPLKRQPRTSANPPVLPCMIGIPTYGSELRSVHPFAICRPQMPQVARRKGVLLSFEGREKSACSSVNSGPWKARVATFPATWPRIKAAHGKLRIQQCAHRRVRVPPVNFADCNTAQSARD